ncbi:unnamed protein product [Rhodiola kirilowii]
MAQIASVNGISIVPVASHYTISMYVGDLDLSVTERQLCNYFNTDGQVTTVRLCRDVATGSSLGYGYVNFTNLDYANKAIQRLNYIYLNGKPLRIDHVFPPRPLYQEKWHPKHFHQES